jgi:hypothetical protein
MLNRPLALSCLAFAFAMGGPGVSLAQDVQHHVHEHGHAVMPFDLAATVHVFRMTETGGIQRVETRKHPGDAQQVRLIREHLQAEAQRFRRGDFGDPASLHGRTMPGLAELTAGAARIRVAYREVPDGAEIVFSARDIHSITSIHRWFGAQLSEHGADARAQ